MKKNLMAVSLITLTCLYGILTSVIILIAILTDFPVSYAVLISLGIIVVQFLISPAINDFVFKHFYKVQWNAEVPEYLQEFISESCNKHNMKYPKIGFIDDGSPNAFTYGRTKNDARVVITRGIFELLNEEEVKSVVAHELGHANHYDMLFMTVAQIVPLVLYYVYQILLRTDSKKSSSSSDNNNDYGAMIGIIAYVLYIVSQYIILWLSRTREYYADRFSVYETKNPSALASGLVKIGFGLAIGSSKENSKVNKGSNALGINDAKISKGIAIGAYNNGGVTKQNVINAMKWERWNVWSKWYELNSTHPLISKRILAISKICPEFGQEPYIEFNEQKTESYVDDFLIEVLISIAPILIFIVFAILTIVNINNKPSLFVGIGGILFTLSLFVLLNRTHKNKGYEETTVSELLGKVKVSNVTSIPAVLEGKIIGRGNPGCIFNEDFVIQDKTGIMFLDYNQPLRVIEKVFALFKSKEYFDKTVKVKGWYRRGIVPYMEIYSMEIDGEIKKCHTYKVTKAIYWIFMIASIVSIIMAFI